MHKHMIENWKNVSLKRNEFKRIQIDMKTRKLTHFSHLKIFKLMSHMKQIRDKFWLISS